MWNELQARVEREIESESCSVTAYPLPALGTAGQIQPLANASLHPDVHYGCVRLRPFPADGRFKLVLELSSAMQRLHAETREQLEDLVSNIREEEGRHGKLVACGFGADTSARRRAHERLLQQNGEHARGDASPDPQDVAARRRGREQVVICHKSCMFVELVVQSGSPRGLARLLYALVHPSLRSLCSPSLRLLHRHGHVPSRLHDVPAERLDDRLGLSPAGESRSERLRAGVRLRVARRQGRGGVDLDRAREARVSDVSFVSTTP